MAGAWKSSDGGAIRCLGSSSVAGLYSADTVLISAAVNVRGITLRTVALATSGASGNSRLEVGGTLFLAATVGVAEMANELFIPAGTAVSFVQGAGSTNVGITYDIH